jgi:hypothetical protein
MKAARTESDRPEDGADVALRLIKIAADIMRTEDLKPGPDWLQQLLDVDRGDVVATDVAAEIIGCHPDTARSRAVIAMESGEPIGILVAGSAWLFSIRRLLDAIEAKDGLPARLAAATRAEKARNFRSRPKLNGVVPIPTEPEPSTAERDRRIVTS